MHLVAQTVLDFEGTSFQPGDVLPSSVHSWDLLPGQVKLGTIWVEGSPSAQLVDAQTGEKMPDDLEPALLVSMVKRGQLTSLNPAEPAQLVAASHVRNIMAGQGHANAYPSKAKEPEPVAKPQQVQGKKHQQHARS